MATISLIGSGNTATALGIALKTVGHTIAEVWSRTEENARKLAQLLGCNYVVDISAIKPDSDFYLAAVKDDAIEELAKRFPRTDKIVAHTSGIKSKDLLRSAGDNYGIFYPNVSMTKGVPVDLNPVLFMIEGANEITCSALKELADSITTNAKIVAEKQRQSLHVASVFANNFTNHLLHIAEILLHEHGMSMDDIRPLLRLHATAIETHSPAVLQTGVAMRGDKMAMERHLSLLQSHPAYRDIYALLSSSIQQTHHAHT